MTQLNESNHQTSGQDRSTQCVAAVIGVIFLVGAFIKATDIATLYPVFQYDGIPKAVWRSLAFGVLAIEILLGSLLLTAYGLRFALRATIFVLGLFSVQLIALLFASQPVGCGCFGKRFGLGWSVEVSLFVGIARNILMVIGAVFALKRVTRPLDEREGVGL